MHIIHIDIPVSVLVFQQRPIEFPGQFVLVSTGEQVVSGVLRRYYAAHPPLRLLLVMQAGDASLLRQGRHIASLLGWDDGDNPYVLPGQENKRHSKISVTMILDGPLPDGTAVTPLSEIIAKAPRADRPGGWRGGDSGRPRIIDDDPTVNHTVSLPSRLWRRLEALGNGNFSAGVRKLAELAGITYEED